MVQLRGVVNWYFLSATYFMLTHPLGDLRTLRHLSMHDTKSANYVHFYLAVAVRVRLT
jgi:hypothetical protein